MSFISPRLVKQNSGLINRAFAFLESLAISDRFLLKVSLGAFVLSLGFLIVHVNSKYLVEIPRVGGTLREGIVGTPRFINPLLAVTNADKDMSALIYAGLMKLGPEGVLVPDMAESVTVSDDGLTYNVVLKSGLAFHDDVAVTADDILFTIAKVQDPALKSPRLGSWDGVTVEKIHDREINFVLQKAYAPFIENLTLGILPRHIWESATAEEFPFSQFNSEPIGSGPFHIERIIRNRSGIPESYVLTANNSYQENTVKIETVVLHFFPSEESLIDALTQNIVDSAASLSPLAIERIQQDRPDLAVYTAELPRTFAVFFNQNESALWRDASAREALSLMIDRAPIISTVLGGFGTPIQGPLPPGFGFATTSPVTTPISLDEARNILTKGGWKMDETTNMWRKKIGNEEKELRFRLATGNADVFQKTADILKNQWGQIGVIVEVEKFDQADLTQSVIRPRKFDALLFGTAVGRDLDFYSFWHSSQRNDPGLNVALYANLTTDDILTRARTTQDFAERIKLYQSFANEIATDKPALFLYTPSFIYVLPKQVQNIHLTGLAEPDERFSGIVDWHMETEAVWPLFSK